jgi:Co/Zn/Cd efflux system component
MHKTAGLRDPAAAFPLPGTRDDVQERRDANRAIAVSAIGLAATGIAELLLAVLTGSVGLLGDAIHNLSDVSTSAVVFLVRELAGVSWHARGLGFESPSLDTQVRGYFRTVNWRVASF